MKAAPPPSATGRELFTSGFDRLIRSQGHDAGAYGTEQLADLLFAGWGDVPLSDLGPSPTDITDDGSPFEWSIALDGDQIEPRVLIEPQVRPMSALPAWRAGLELLARLEQEAGADLERFRAVAPLFEPHGLGGNQFSVWFGATARRGGDVRIKVYLDPAAQGQRRRRQVMASAMGRLDLSSAWAFLDGHVLAGDGATLSFFSLDLDRTSSARVKVYTTVHAPHASLEPLLAACPGYEPGHASAVMGALGAAPHAVSRPPQLCFAFRSGSSTPEEVTLYSPLRSYVPDDVAALDAVGRAFGPAAAERLGRAAEAVSRRPLDEGAGLVAWVSCKLTGRRGRVTGYLSAEAFRDVVSAVPAAPWACEARYAGQRP